MITDTISGKIAEALKAHDEIRLSTLRLLSSALNYEFIAKQHRLSEEEELVVVRREIRKRKEAIEAFNQARGKLTSGGTDINERIKREEAELAILKEFLPEEISEKELNMIITQTLTQTGATSAKEMGQVMNLVMKQVAGRADGALIARLVKEKLS